MRIEDIFFADTHLTPFMHSFKSRTDVFSPIMLSDYPLIKHLEDVIHMESMDKLKEIFRRQMDELERKNYFFSFEEMSPNIFLKRLNYTAELVRQSCYSSKRVVLIMNYHYVDTFIEYWKDLSPSVNSLSQLYRKNDEQVSLPDFIEKLVLIDLLYGGFIHDNFIKYNSFPYPCKNQLTWKAGWPNIFDLWTHYHTHYTELVRNIPFNKDKYNEFISKFNVGIDKLEFSLSEKDMKNDVLSRIEDIENA